MPVFHRNKREIKKLHENIDSGQQLNLKDNIKKSNNIDNNLPLSVSLLKTPEGDKCYVVGTVHFSRESQDEVAQIIQDVQPQILLFELCKDRAHVLKIDDKDLAKETEGLSFTRIVDILKDYGICKGLFYIFFEKKLAHFTREYGLITGGEFRRAMKEARKIHSCKVHLCDRPIDVTVARMINALTWWQAIRFYIKLLLQTISTIKPEINQLAIAKSLEELSEQFPSVAEVFVKERDLFMTYVMQFFCTPTQDLKTGKWTPVTIVAVVGRVHLNGITENWRKVKESDIEPLMKYPPTSLTTRIIELTIKAFVAGTILYIGYRLFSKNLI